MCVNVKFAGLLGTHLCSASAPLLTTQLVASDQAGRGARVCWMVFWTAEKTVEVIFDSRHGADRVSEASGARPRGRV